jgi:hypothetical protein
VRPLRSSPRSRRPGEPPSVGTTPIELTRIPTGSPVQRRRPLLRNAHEGASRFSVEGSMPLRRWTSGSQAPAPLRPRTCGIVARFSLSMVVAVACTAQVACSRTRADGTAPPPPSASRPATQKNAPPIQSALVPQRLDGDALLKDAERRVIVMQSALKDGSMRAFVDAVAPAKVLTASSCTAELPDSESLWAHFDQVKEPLRGSIARLKLPAVYVGGGVPLGGIWYAPPGEFRITLDSVWKIEDVACWGEVTVSLPVAFPRHWKATFRQASPVFEIHEAKTLSLADDLRLDTEKRIATFKIKHRSTLSCTIDRISEAAFPDLDATIFSPLIVDAAPERVVSIYLDCRKHHERTARELLVIGAKLATVDSGSYVVGYERGED